jgi:hypothetical protein
MSGIGRFIDRRTLADETDLPRAAIDAIWRRVRVYRFGDGRKVYALREEVEAQIAASQVHRDAVRP